MPGAGVEGSRRLAISPRPRGVDRRLLVVADAPHDGVVIRSTDLSSLPTDEAMRTCRARYYWSILRPMMATSVAALRLRVEHPNAADWFVVGARDQRAAREKGHDRCRRPKRSSSREPFSDCLLVEEGPLDYIVDPPNRIEMYAIRRRGLGVCRRTCAGKRCSPAPPGFLSHEPRSAPGGGICDCGVAISSNTDHSTLGPRSGPTSLGPRAAVLRLVFGEDSC